MTRVVKAPAHAKVNLFLRVLAREVSGYHCIETLFMLLELHDDVTARRSERGISLEVLGADVGPETENLAYRAADLVLNATGRPFGVALQLTKRIPVQAGLGGGSSDAAATLHAVNSLAGGVVPAHELLQMAAKLGSDVPFFASRAAMAFGWGRGERLMRLAAPPVKPVLIGVPRLGISTRSAYESLDRGVAEGARRATVVLDGDAFGSWGDIARLGGNDFEGPLFGREPVLRELFESMARTGPLLVRLAGSGSAVFAVYKNESERDGAASELGERDWSLIRTSTRQAAAPGAGGAVESPH